MQSVVVVQSPSHVRLFATPWTATCQASLSLTISQRLPKFMSIESATPSNHLNLCHPLNQHQSHFQQVSCSHQWPKYWSFSIIPSKEYSGLISFKTDWSDLLAFQGTLKSSSALQFESISSSAFCLIYHPALTSVHDYWKDRSLDYTDLCQLSDAFAF